MPPPGSYSQVFGGNNIYPSRPTYLLLSPLTANIQLAWPIETAAAGQTVVADIIDVNATAPNLTIQLSDATQASDGFAALINNIGANSVNVLNFSGGVIATIASGTVWQLYLADNTTQNGTWRAFQFGVGVSQATAAALAGAGLLAIGTTLNENIVVQPKAVNYVAVLGDRATAIEWTGGVGTLTLSNGFPANWFVIVKNGGTGVWTASATGGATIDGATTLALNPQQSCFLIFDGINYFTLGFGQQLNSIFDFVQIDLTGLSGNVVLAGAQLNRISYRFIGAIAGNVSIIVSNVVQQYWVDNETTGAFTLTVKTAAGTGIALGQGSRNILYCDATNVLNAVSFGSTGFPNGTVGSPSIFFAASPATGVYSPGPDQLAAATHGTQRVLVDASGHWTFNGADTAALVFGFNGSAAGAAITMRIAAPVSSPGATPILQLVSTVAAGVATLSLTGNNGTVGTNDLAILQDGGNVAWVLNRANAALNFGTNGVTRGSVSGTGTWLFSAPSGNNALQLTTATYTIGNATDNPNVSFSGTGTVAFTTIPTAPTAGAGSNDTRLATTAFVATSFAPLASPAFTGTPTAPTAAPGTNTTQIATTAYVLAAGFAPLASPAFTGTPTAPTAAVGTSTTQIATTAFANPNSVLGASGHAELPGGLIIQWGQVTAASGTSPTDIAITYPIAFPTAVIGVWPVGHRSVATAGQANLSSNFSVNATLTGATITIDNSTGNPSVYSGTWFALGY